MTVLDEVLKWSEGLEHLWMRDALRRLVTQGLLSEVDRGELFAFFQQESDMLDESLNSAPIPLAANHLPNRVGAEGPVSITQIGPISGVNALASGATIPLESCGLNVIYGRNASGKSGFSRVLKKACRARDSEEQVLGDVFSDSSLGQSAEFKLVVGDSPRDVVWTPNVEPEETASIVVFDARCARLYLDKAGEIACMPYGLDVFESLCGLMDEFTARLDSNKARVEGGRVALPTLEGETAAKRFLGALTAKTTDAEIASACEFDQQASDRLDEMRGLLAKNPEDEAKRLRRLAGRLRTVHQSVDAIGGFVGGENPRLSTLIASVVAAREAADRASALAFDDCPLDGVGSDPWRILFDAAQTYSVTAAYEGEAFPFLGENARCVLCQQPLDDDARQRFEGFRHFVSDTAARALDQAERDLRAGRDELLTHITSIGAMEDALLDEVLEVDESLGRTLGDVRGGCGKYASQQVADPASTDVAALGALCERVTDVEVAAVQLEVDAVSILRSLDTDERSRLVQQAAELEAQKVLAASRASVAERRDQLKHLDLIAKAKGSLRTRIVTDAGKQIAESAVTAELRDSWAQALLDLGLSEARVKMKKAGSKGNYLTCLELDGCTGKQGMTDVLSEGEQRVVALAAFMAELGLAEQGNAVVFDDPVSSLDHNHRELVAKSIVRLAESRQVIVFTHDLVFLKDLDAHGEDAGVAVTIRGLQFGSRAGAGICEPGACPAELLPLKGHLAVLETQRLGLKAEYEESGSAPAYQKAVKAWYVLLREAWEKAVEETLLNRVVESYVDGVKTTSLRAVAVEDLDWDDVSAGVTQCSKHAHRASAARNSPTPLPAQLFADLQVLRLFQSRVKTRRQDLEARRPAPR